MGGCIMTGIQRDIPPKDYSEPSDVSSRLHKALKNVEQKIVKISSDVIGKQYSKEQPYDPARDKQLQRAKELMARYGIIEKGADEAEPTSTLESWHKCASKLEKDPFFTRVLREHIDKKCTSDEQKCEALLDYGYNEKGQNIDLVRFSEGFTEEVFAALGVDILFKDEMEKKSYAAVNDGTYKKAKILLELLKKNPNESFLELEEFKQLLEIPLQKDFTIDEVFRALEP